MQEIDLCKDYAGTPPPWIVFPLGEYNPYSRRFATVTARTAWKGTIYPPSPGRKPGSKEHELEGGLVLLEPRESV